jgi:hypothetical protein
MIRRACKSFAMKRAIALLIACSFLATGLAGAQGAPAQVPPAQQNASPIEVAAQPAHAAPGSLVTIQGTVAAKGSNGVTITVKPPGGVSSSHAVLPDANGAFALEYRDTKASGTYSVQAKVGPSSAAATFAVGSTEIARNTIQEVQELLRTADSWVREGKRQYAGNPALAGRNRAATDKRIAQLQQYIGEAKRLWTPSNPGSPGGPPTLADMLLEITAQLQSHPELQARYAPELNKLQAWSEQSQASLKHFKSREPLLKSVQSMNGQRGGMLTYASFLLAEAEAPEGAAPSGAGTCETAQQVGEFFEMVGSALSLIGTPIAVAYNLATQWFGSQAGSPTGIPTAAHGAVATAELQEWQHEVAEAPEKAMEMEQAGLKDVLPELNPSQIYQQPGAPNALKIGVASIAAHLGVLLADAMLRAGCVEFKGPFQATMHADAKIYDHTWWKFTVQIAGNLTLLVNKSDWTLRGKVPFVGEFEGQGTNFTVWEDAVPVLYKKLFQPGMTISWHKVSATRVTNLTACTSCVFPLRGVAVASEDSGLYGTFGPPVPDVSNPGLAQQQPNYSPRAGILFGETPGENGVSGQPTNAGISMLPGLKGLLSTPGFNLLSAAYFRIPVEGVIDNSRNASGHAVITTTGSIGSVSLTLLPAKSDWDPDLINAHVRYVVLTSGLPLGVPLLLDFGLPYPSAEFILKRALGNTTPGPATANTTIEMKDAVVLSQSGTRVGPLALDIKFQNINDMPRMPVASTPWQSGKADYKMNFTASNQGDE